MTNQVRFSLPPLLLAFSTLFANTLYAQQNTLKITPFQPLLGKFTIQYERAMSPKNTIAVEFQKWNERRQTGAGLFAFGIFVSATDVTTTKGYRMQVLARHYTKQALEGAFIEGGGYIGKHDIEVRNETSSFNPYAFLGSDPFSFYQSDEHIDHYNNVHVAGLKAGAGWQKSAGILTFECSAGLNLNFFNDKNVRPTLGLKQVAPYGRLMMGVKF